MPKNAKLDRLRQFGVLNPRPEPVRAPRFQNSPFFDPNDLVQVKAAPRPPGRHQQGRGSRLVWFVAADVLPG
ncbi:hypothetical protein ACFQ3P_40995 [Paraburkholderia sabiae]|uniref:Uncharacterized protein n=1 Tax=Paraburkholderia sabiae TaxID=273251 RepID=A0ABU9QSB3_9BURK|nr:hypothetical protein [Paraburkholderia sabiae]WJZ79564.1 hypothetical protein QEN71_40400 [Paraburkholderia sabiae]CAD6563220.1 hypothetical protein LMG24235_08462 [Paraburkholderia sabiae]